MWKKIFIIQAITIGIFLITGNIALADDAVETPSENTGADTTAGTDTSSTDQKDWFEKNEGDTNFKEMTFDVSKNLSLEGEEQGMSYFTDTKHSPAVSLILAAIRYATRIIGAIAMLLLIIGGYYMITSQGDEATITKGKDVVKFAVIGIAIVFLSYLIMTFVQSFFIK